MDVEREVAGGTSSARRRRERRLRSMLRHERMAVAMALAEALHHSSGLKVMERAQHAALRGQKTGTRAGVAGPAPVTEYVAPAPAVAPFSAPVVSFEAPAPVVGYVAPGPAVTCAAPAPVDGSVAPTPAVTYAAPAPVIGYVAPVPSVTYATPASVFEYVAPAPVLEYIAPTPAVSFVAPSQQLRPASTAAAVTTGVNLDAEFVGSASQVVGSLPHGEVFHQVHQVPLAGGEIPENLSLPGARPGVLEDPAPQGAVTVGYVAASGPLLAVPLLASTASEAVDKAALAFLLQRSLDEKMLMELEEDSKRMAELSLLWKTPYERRSAEQKDRIRALMSRRKKKRKKKKLPRTPRPRQGCRRPCDLQRQVPTETGTHSVLLGPGAVLGQSRCAGVAQRQGYGQTVQETVLVPHLQFIEGRHPFVPQRQISMVLPVQKAIETPQLHRSNGRCPLIVLVVPCPLSCPGAHGSDFAENYGGAAVAARRFDISVVVQRQIPMVLFRTIEIPVATAAVVTSCSSSANCPISAAPVCCGGVYVAMSCGGGGFTPDGAFDSALDSVMPTT